MTLERKLITMLKGQKWLVEVLDNAQKLNLKNWYISGGTIRNNVWDIISFGKPIHQTLDIDLIFFDKQMTPEDLAKKKKTISKKVPIYSWEIRNMALLPEAYESMKEACSDWFCETASSIGITKNQNDEIEILHTNTSLTDLFEMIVRPSAIKHIESGLFHERYTKKLWLENWPKLRIIEATMD